MDRYLAVLDQLPTPQSGDPVVLSALAFKASLGRKPAGMDQAIQFLKQALALGTTDPVDYSLLGELLALRHRPSEAIQVLQAGLVLDPYYIPYYELLAKSYINMGNLGQAGEVVKQGLQQFPESHVSRELQEKGR